ncbi:unnamed protein product [Schistosoma curassoni]|uniref:Uncharacterized protein n=1 Tax=Schistosoma curassoni TaxID=6186 RepID=A0A183KNU6_9TREM|nr:unnamed protein product [Schistosoma curassoni]
MAIYIYNSTDTQIQTTNINRLFSTLWFSIWYFTFGIPIFSFHRVRLYLCPLFGLLCYNKPQNEKFYY